MNVTLLAARLQPLLTSRSDELAEMANFLKRSENLTGSKFIQSLADVWGCKPDASYERLALPMGISRSTLFERFDPNATKFCRSVLIEALTHSFQANRQSFPLLDRFDGIYLDDCTQLPLPDACAEEFSGCGSGVCELGKAGMKVFTRFEIQQGEICQMSIHPAKTADAKTVDEADPLPAGSLHLADLGFVHFAKMQQRSDQGVYYVSRLPMQTTLSLKKGEPRQTLVSLLQTARKQGETEIDLDDVVVGTKEEATGRLVVLACPQEVVQKRLRKAQEDAVRRGRTLSERKKEMCHWQVFFCNVEREKLTTEEVYQIYRLRWQVELLFKRFKSHGGMRRSTSGKPERVKCEWYVKLLIQILKNWQHLLRGGPLCNVNQSLLSEVVGKYFSKLIAALGEGIEGVERVLQELEHELNQLRERSSRPGKPTVSQRFSVGGILG